MVWQLSIQQEMAWQRHSELLRESLRRARLLRPREPRTPPKGR